MISKLTNEIIETILNKLMDTKEIKPFKYIVTCTIIQKNGAGFHTSSSCLWDNKDGYYIFETENDHLHCFTNVYGLSL